MKSQYSGMKKKILRTYRIKTHRQKKFILALCVLRSTKNVLCKSHTIRYGVRQATKGFTVQICTEKPAFFVSLEQYDDLGVFDDNMLTLLPKRDASVRFMSYKDSRKGLRIFSLV